MQSHSGEANRSPFDGVGRPHSTTRVAIILFILIAPIYAFSPQGRPAYHDLTQGAEITRVALSLVTTGNFADPFHSLPTGPTAHVAPAYVFLYALVAKLFGIGAAGAFALWSLNIGFLSLQLALLPVLSERLGLGILPGVLAAVFGTIVQPYRVLPEWESLFTGALLVTLAVLTLPYFERSHEWQRSALLGFLWGIAILTNPNCVLLFFAWPLIAAPKHSRDQWMRAGRTMAVIALGAFLACLPWFVRNYERFHTVIFVRDNLGLELSMANNSCAQPTVLENLQSGCYERLHPNVNPVVAGQVFDEGEIRFNRERLHQALTWISSNPRAFAFLTVRRFLKYWFPYLGGLRYAVPTGILTVFSFVGLALMFRKNRRAAWMLASTLLLYPCVHYVTQFEARFRYPIFWATLLLAAYAILELIYWLRLVDGPRSSVSGETHASVPL